MQLISGAAFRERSSHPLSGVTVLQVLAELDTSLAAQAAIETAAALERVGAVPLVAADGGSMVSELQARGGIYIRLPIGSRGPLDAALGVGRLVGVIRTEAVGLVHARSRRAAWIALAATRMTRTPFVTSFPAQLDTGNRLASGFGSVLARGDRVLVEWACAARMAETLRPAARGKIHVIGPGLDPSAFAAANVPPARVRALRRSWNCPPDEPVVLVFTEFAASEAQALLCATARFLQRTGSRPPRFVHIEVGSGSHVCTLDAATQSLLSLAPCEDLPAALLAASVVALPAGRAEVLCRLAVGAQAMGTPVIVADVGPLAETVLAPPDSTQSLGTGWRIPPGEPAALAAAVGAGLGLGASARDRLSSRARAFVERDLSTERMLAETLRAFVAARDDAPEP